MKKVILSSGFLFFLSIMVFGQVEEKIDKEGVVPGKIIKDGKEFSGYIKKTGRARGYPAPWQFQDGIRFIPKDVFEKTEKIKANQYEKYGPGDCEGYIYDTLTFESVKFSNMTYVGLGMLGQKMFMQVLSKDKISLYHFFNSPPKVVSGSDTFEKYYVECAVPNLVYKIGKDGNLKIIDHLKIEKDLADCPSVVEKYKSGGYESAVVQEGKGLLKLVGKLNEFEMIRIKAIEDYNKNCN